jgi:hypothetical protein
MKVKLTIEVPDRKKGDKVKSWEFDLDEAIEALRIVADVLEADKDSHETQKP